MGQGEQVRRGRRGDWKSGQKADTGARWGTERRPGFIQRVTEGPSRVLNREVELSNQHILRDHGSCHEGPGFRMHV